MRRKFAKDLYDLMIQDKKIILITADLGYRMLDKIRNDMPEQFYNVGAAEQIAINIAIGMALKGKIPVVYSITPFLLFRPFEAIRNYINHEKIPVKLVGGGRNNDYSDGGFSHNASDHEIIRYFTNIDFIVPEDDFNLMSIIYSDRPAYLNLSR